MKQTPPSPRRLARLALVSIAIGCASGPAAAQASSASGGSGIYTCINSRGQHLRSDRPIVECTDREQRVLNRDGSLQRVVPPTLTADERAAKEAVERRIAAERAAKKEAERADRLLLQRYRSEEAHARAREAALEPVRIAVKQSEQRLRALEIERKPLVDEAEFYVDRQMPLKLKQQFDAIDATAEAQRVLMANQQAEIVRINALYDTELARLRQLWAGAEPGSLGPLSAPQGSPVPVVARTIGGPARP